MNKVHAIRAYNRTDRLCLAAAMLVTLSPAGAMAVAVAQDAVTKPEPLTSPDQWFSADDYPVAASLNGLEGKTVFKLGIATDGRVASCVITVSSGLESLDETACTILTQRARFKPALDRKNLPVVGSYTGRINWRLPENNAARIAEFPKRLHISYDVDANGAVENCSVKENMGNATYIPKLGKAVDPCSVMMQSKRLMPVIDADGNAIAAHVETINETRITPR